MKINFINTNSKRTKILFITFITLIISSCGDNTAVQKLSLSTGSSVVDTQETSTPNGATGGAIKVESPSGFKLSAQIKNMGTRSSKICNINGFCMNAGFTK